MKIVVSKYTDHMLSPSNDENDPRLVSRSSMRMVMNGTNNIHTEKSNGKQHTDVKDAHSDSYVYIHSRDHSWIPATLIKSEGDIATVVVQRYTKEEEILSLMTPSGGRNNADQTDVQTVRLQDYHNNHLPLQNVTDAGILHEYEDMVHLPYLHEPAILYNLKYRHMNAKPYTRTGDIVIAVNPYKWYNDLYSEKTRNLYAQKLFWEHSESDPREQVEPHVYEVSALSFRGMLHDNEKQSILVSGESGAGKTETVKICMNHIASLQQLGNGVYDGSDEYSSSSSSPKVVQKVLESNPLLEAFGNAKTRRNDNSSRFGKFIQLQFNNTISSAASASKLAGSKCEVYLLEKNRVVSHDNQERTFHIFYQLLAADENDKKMIWEDGLTNTTNESFRYVGETDTNTIEGVPDRDRFQLTKTTLNLIGIHDEEFKTLMQVMCVVLQLGNIRFAPKDDDKDTSIVVTKKELGNLAKLMGISDIELIESLTKRTMKAKSERYKVPLKPETAKDTCDAFAKEIYAKVFLWLVNKINDATSATAAENKNDAFVTIGLLDIFGFESFTVNRFDQLCINYANEKLQQKFTEDIFRSVQEEYKEEGIPLAEITYDDNTDVLDLIEGRTGLLAMLNEECVRPKGSATGFVNKALQNNRKSPCLIQDNMERMNFSIRHFAGKVMYSAEDFVVRNIDNLPSDLMECGAKCTNNAIITTVFNEQVEEAVASKKKNRRVQRAQSYISAETVWTKYKNQLSDLMSNLRKTRTRYIRCIKPNTLKKPLIMEHHVSVDQLRSAGIVAGVMIARSAFPNRLCNKTVYKRYNSMWDRKLFPTEGSSLREECLALLSCALRLKEEIIDDRIVKAFVVGKTKSYFRSGALEYLESKRLKGLDAQATTIQKIARGHLVRNALKKQREAELNEKARLEQLAKEAEGRRLEAELKEQARLEQVAKEAEERRLERHKKLQVYRDQIDSLRMKIDEVDKKKMEMIREAKIRTDLAKEMQKQCLERSEMTEEEITKRRNFFYKEMSIAKSTIVTNSSVIAVLKEERKYEKKKNSLKKKQRERFASSNETIANSKEMDPSTFGTVAPVAGAIAAKNDELRQSIQKVVEVHKILDSQVDKKQEQYVSLAKDRLTIQKHLAEILTLINDKCKRPKLRKKVEDIALRCEADYKKKMGLLQAEFGHYETVGK